jgi:hypothetical protein
LFIVDAGNNVVAQSDDTNAAALGGTGRAEETAVASNIPAGQYRVIVINSISVSPTPRYDAAVTYNLTPVPNPPPTTANIFATTSRRSSMARAWAAPPTSRRSA